MLELGIDQFSQARRIRFVPDMPSLQPGEFRVSGAGTRFRHLSQAGVDGVGQDRGHEEGPVLGLLPALEMDEVARESGPVVHVGVA